MIDATTISDELTDALVVAEIAVCEPPRFVYPNVSRQLEVALPVYSATATEIMSVPVTVTTFAPPTALHVYH